MTKRVAVVGAGITGVTTAYYLARQGYSVTVYEQERYPAMRTSFANGGQISVSNSEVWTTWSNVWKGIKWMFTKDAPLLIRPRLDFKQWKWMAKFLWHTFNLEYHKNTAATIKMGLESRKLYDEICKEESIEFDRSDCGILHFYKDEKYWSNAVEARFIYENNGAEWKLLAPAEAKMKDATLNNINDMIGAAWTKDDWTGDIHKFCYGLAEVLKTKYNVSFKFGHAPDVNLLLSLDGFDAVVISAGVGSVELAEQVGDTLDIYPVKGYSITINNVDPKHLPRVSLLDDQAKIVTSTLGNRFRVAGTAELNGENYDIRRDRIEPLLRWVHTNFPDINTHDYTSWACLRPMTPNMMPVVKQSDNNTKVFYNTGHGHLGWTLAPVTASTVAEIIKNKL
jgi:D-amino-acid dehydrogenase